MENVSEPVTPRFQWAMNEAERRIDYFTNLWISDTNPKKREEYEGKIEFYNCVFFDLAEKMSKLLDKNYGKRT